MVADTDADAAAGASTRPSPAPLPSPGLPTVAPYTPLEAEALPNLKKAAADFVQALTTRARGEQPGDALARAAALTSAGFDSDAALNLAGPLFADSVSTGEILYPQLSGLAPMGLGARSAGVMVVVRQRMLTDGGSTSSVTRVCDVRLEVQQGQWRVTDLVSVGGEPVDRPTGLAPQTEAVLDDPRIDLPDTCRWDIHAGIVAPNLLVVLSLAAAVAPLSVAVLRTGHPDNVFASSRISNHTQGRAVDVWRIDGQPVVSTGAATGATRRVLDAAFGEARTRQTGSPPGSDLDGAGRRSFTDLVHQDHLHLAVGAS